MALLLLSLARTYIKNVCEKIEKLFEVDLRNYGSPLEGGYHPELDTLDLLLEDQVSRYCMLIGSANWAVTLGRFDIHYAVSTMGWYSQAPREGHLKAMLRVFGYLKHHMKRQIIYNVSKPDHSNVVLPKQNWKELYPDAVEELPADMPEPKGEPVIITTNFDADHAHDLETRRSVTGVLIFLNNTPVQWYSKRQATVESSTYGSELVAARIACELTMAMRYKLCMLGVRVEGPSVMFGDNQSVITSCTISG